MSEDKERTRLEAAENAEEKTETEILQEKTDVRYMKEALRLAKKAYANGDVAIGCVIVHEEKIIGRGYNRRNKDATTLAHAESSSGLETGRLHHVCNPGAMSNVCWCHRAGQNSGSGNWCHESQGGLRRFYHEPSG